MTKQEARDLIDTTPFSDKNKDFIKTTILTAKNALFKK